MGVRQSRFGWCGGIRKDARAQSAVEFEPEDARMLLVTHAVRVDRGRQDRDGALEGAERNARTTLIFVCSPFFWSEQTTQDR